MTSLQNPPGKRPLYKYDGNYDGKCLSRATIYAKSLVSALQVLYLCPSRGY